MTDSDANVDGLSASGPTVKRYWQETPLHKAAALGQSRRVRELLSAGADPNAKDINGLTPLHLAAVQGHVESVLTLLGDNADPNGRAKNGATPLHQAAFQGHVETVRTLLCNNANPNPRGYSGYTPLHLAASQGHTETVRTLLDGGADREARNIAGKIPMEMAIEKGHSETRKAFLTSPKSEPVPHTKAVADNDAVARDRQQGPGSQPDDVTKVGGGTAGDVIESTGRDVAANGTHTVSRRALGIPAVHRPGWRRNIRRPKEEKHMPTLSIIGEPGSGKSHFATLLYIHLQTHSELDVYCDFANVEWNTINNADRLVRGIPLEPTPSDEIVHDVLKVSWSETVKRGMGPIHRETTSTRELKIPVIDSSGELLQIAMGDIFRTSGRITLRELEQHIADRNYDGELVTTLYNEVFRADRFCFIVDAARGMDRRRGTSAQVKHSAFLQNLKNFREANKLPPILNSMLVFTKYDAAKSRIEEFLIRNGAVPDATTIANYQAPQLMAQLTSLQGGNGHDGNEATPVKVVLSSTEWEQPPMTETQIQEKYGSGLGEDEKMDLLEGMFEVKLLENGNPVPAYDQEEYEKVVEWLKAML